MDLARPRPSVTTNEASSVSGPHPGALWARAAGGRSAGRQTREAAPRRSGRSFGGPMKEEYAHG